MSWSPSANLVLLLALHASGAHAFSTMAISVSDRSALRSMKFLRTHAAADLKLKVREEKTEDIRTWE